MTTILNLDEIAKRCEAATPGPWHINYTDDQQFMCMTLVTTTDDLVPDWHNGDRPDKYDPRVIVCGTLVQSPRYVDVADEKWDENALFIAHARTDVPNLLAAVRELKEENERLRKLPAAVTQPDEYWEAVRDDLRDERDNLRQQLAAANERIRELEVSIRTNGRMSGGNRFQDWARGILAERDPDDIDMPFSGSIERKD